MGLEAQREGDRMGEETVGKRFQPGRLQTNMKRWDVEKTPLETQHMEPEKEYLEAVKRLDIRIRSLDAERNRLEMENMENVNKYLAEKMKYEAERARLETEKKILGHTVAVRSPWVVSTTPTQEPEYTQPNVVVVLSAIILKLTPLSD